MSAPDHEGCDCPPPLTERDLTAWAEAIAWLTRLGCPPLGVPERVLSALRDRRRLP